MCSTVGEERSKATEEAQFSAAIQLNDGADRLGRKESNSYPMDGCTSVIGGCALYLQRFTCARVESLPVFCRASLCRSEWQQSNRVSGKNIIKSVRNRSRQEHQRTTRCHSQIAEVHGSP